MRHGHYDAALGVARDIGETANLLLLFSADPGAFGRWRSCDDRTRLNEFRPSGVRQALEQLNRVEPGWMRHHVAQFISGERCQRWHVEEAQARLQVIRDHPRPLCGRRE